MRFGGTTSASNHQDGGEGGSTGRANQVSYWVQGGEDIESTNTWGTSITPSRRQKQQQRQQRCELQYRIVVYTWRYGPFPPRIRRFVRGEHRCSNRGLCVLLIQRGEDSISEADTKSTTAGSSSSSRQRQRQKQQYNHMQSHSKHILSTSRLPDSTWIISIRFEPWKIVDILHHKCRGRFAMMQKWTLKGYRRIVLNAMIGVAVALEWFWNVWFLAIVFGTDTS